MKARLVLVLVIVIVAFVSGRLYQARVDARDAMPASLDQYTVEVLAQGLKCLDERRASLSQEFPQYDEDVNEWCETRFDDAQDVSDCVLRHQE